MSWYRSYLQESTLYSTSPGSSPALLASSPEVDERDTQRASRPSTAAGGLTSTTQQQWQSAPKCVKESQQLHHHQQQQTGLGSGGQICAAPAAAVAAPAATCNLSPPLTLTAVLEAAWEGGVNPGSTTAAPAAPPAAPAGVPVGPKRPAASKPSHAGSPPPAPQQGTSGTRPEGSPAALLMQALPLSQTAADAAAAAVQTPAAPAAPPASGAPSTSQQQRTAAGGHAEQPEQQQEQQQQLKKKKNRGPVAGSSSSCNAEDPLGFDLCWEGPGLQPRVQAGSSSSSTALGTTVATNTTTTSSSSSSTTATRGPQQQQQQPGQSVVPADDSWEALVSSMRHSHPDISSRHTMKAAAHAAGSSGGSGSGSSAKAAPLLSVGQPEGAPVDAPQLPLPLACVSGGSSSSSGRSSFRVCGAAGSTSTCAPADGTSAAAVDRLAMMPLGAALLPVLNSRGGSSGGGSSSRGLEATPRGSSGKVRPLSPRHGPNTPLAIHGSTGGSTGTCIQPAAASPRVRSPPLFSSSSSEIVGVSSSPRATATTTPLLLRSASTPSSSGSVGAAVAAAGSGLAGTAVGSCSSPRPALSPRSVQGCSWFKTGGPDLAPSSSPRSCRLGGDAAAAAGASRGSAGSIAAVPAGDRGRSRAPTDSRAAASSRSASPVGLRPSSPRPGTGAAGERVPLLLRRSSSSSSSVSSLQLAALGPARASAAAGGGGVGGSSGGRSFVQSVRVVGPSNRAVGWWVCGGLAVAAVAGGAVAAVYGIMSYFLKMSMVYSLAWKAATGVAAAEGLAIGGWSCKNVRVQQAEAAKSAAELARLRKQAAQELTALRALLQQQEASHTHEVSSLTALNERLTRLTQSLQSDNSGLQGALDRAAADRKALEAAAALEVKRAETSALVGATADATGRVVGEVAALSRGQAQLTALVQELREDLMGLVARQEGGDSSQQQGVEEGPGVSRAVAAGKEEGSANELSMLLGEEGGPAAQQGEAAEAVLVVRGQQAVGVLGGCADEDGEAGSSSSSDSTIQLGVSQQKQQGRSSNRQGEQSCSVVSSPPSVRVSSVRGGVHASLAATVSGTLEL